MSERAAHVGQSDSVPASEYDALIEVVRLLASELTMGVPADVILLVNAEIGTDAADFMRRILIDNEGARELFGGVNG